MCACVRVLLISHLIPLHVCVCACVVDITPYSFARVLVCVLLISHLIPLHVCVCACVVDIIPYSFACVLVCACC